MAKPKKKTPAKAQRDQINIRLNPGDRERIEHGAELARRNVSDFVRLSLLDAVSALEKHGKTGTS